MPARMWLKVYLKMYMPVHRKQKTNMQRERKCEMVSTQIVSPKVSNATIDIIQVHLKFSLSTMNGSGEPY